MRAIETIKRDLENQQKIVNAAVLKLQTLKVEFQKAKEDLLE